MASCSSLAARWHSQRWRSTWLRRVTILRVRAGGTFMRNHLPPIAAIDLFVVPTIGFRLLYALVIVRLARRELVWINVTAHPTADWIAQQITEAFRRRGRWLARAARRRPGRSDIKEAGRGQRDDG